MLTYTSRAVIQLLKKYEMFLNSLNLIKEEKAKEQIIDELDKVEEQILLATNDEYEEAYTLLLDKKSNLIDDERQKLKDLIDLIENRKEYLNNRKIKHQQITGSLVELKTFIGEDKLVEYKHNLRIIEKYQANSSEYQTLTAEIKDLDSKIEESSKKIQVNTNLNSTLEKKMKKTLDDAFNDLNSYELISDSEEIEKEYDKLQYATKIASENLKYAKEKGNDQMIIECDDMLSSITLEFENIKEKKLTLELIAIYDKTVDSYDELLEKRQKMHDILKDMTSTNLYSIVGEELEKEYNTIRIEAQDITTYNVLTEQKSSKNKTLYEIEEENKSDEYQEVLKELLENERKYQEFLMAEERRKEYEERQRKLIEETKLQEERLKRQRLIKEKKIQEQQEKKSSDENIEIKSKSPKVESVKFKEEIPIKEQLHSTIPNENIKIKENDFSIKEEIDVETIPVIQNNKLVPKQVGKKEVKKQKEDTLLRTESDIFLDIGNQGR